MILINLTGTEKVKEDARVTGLVDSYGAEVDFKVDGKDESITVYIQQDLIHFTVLHFMVLAPEHKLAKEPPATDETRKDVEDYIFKSINTFKY